VSKDRESFHDLNPPCRRCNRIHDFQGGCQRPMPVVVMENHVVPFGISQKCDLITPMMHTGRCEDSVVNDHFEFMMDEIDRASMDD
jgi:hypothetical protein